MGFEGHRANLIKVTILPESLETYKQKCGGDIQEYDFELKDIAEHAPEDFYKQIGIDKNDLKPAKRKLDKLKEISKTIKGGEEEM